MIDDYCSPGRAGSALARPSIRVDALHQLLGENTLQAGTPPLGVAEVAELVGLSAHTLRYYENEGLVCPARGSSGYREYGDADVRRLIFLTRMRASGMTMRDLKRYIRLVDQGDATIAERRQIMLDQRKRIKQQLRELALALETTEYKLRVYGGHPDGNSLGLPTDDPNTSSMTTVFDEIAGRRIRLVPFSADLARAVLAGDLSDLAAADGWPHDDTVDGLAMAVEHDEPPGWMVVLDGEVIGDCGTYGSADGAGIVEIGYGLAAPFRGKGYGTEAVAAMTEWLLDRPEIRRVRARTLANNPASQRLLERNGFSHTGHSEDGEAVYERNA